jgi:hypothetical protein
MHPRRVAQASLATAFFIVSPEVTALAAEEGKPIDTPVIVAPYERQQDHRHTDPMEPAAGMPNSWSVPGVTTAGVNYAAAVNLNAPTTIIRFGL